MGKLMGEVNGLDLLLNDSTLDSSTKRALNALIQSLKDIVRVVEEHEERIRNLEK